MRPETRNAPNAPVVVVAADVVDGEDDAADVVVVDVDVVVVGPRRQMRPEARNAVKAPNGANSTCPKDLPMALQLASFSSIRRNILRDANHHQSKVCQRAR